EVRSQTKLWKCKPRPPRQNPHFPFFLERATPELSQIFLPPSQLRLTGMFKNGHRMVARMVFVNGSMKKSQRLLFIRLIDNIVPSYLVKLVIHINCGSIEHGIVKKGKSEYPTDYDS
ncbi:hypothetical protein HAX54_047589, partial [Datura stramonium]|nr:hypothetical protein [Datura stramonium]